MENGKRGLFYPLDLILSCVVGCVVVVELFHFKNFGTCIYLNGKGGWVPLITKRAARRQKLRKRR